MIHSDSRYAVDLVRHGTTSKTNVLLRDFMVRLWKTKEIYDVRIFLVMGRNRDIGNDLADKYAGEGAELGDDVCLGRWRPSD